MSQGRRLYAARADARGGLRIRDYDDLERYCYFVAGTVGELLTGLFDLSVPGLSPEARRAFRARSVSFGLGLQMVNVLEDVASDLSHGR